MNFGSVLVGLLVLLIVLSAFYAIMSTWLCLRLKRHHEALWISLGRPMPALANRFTGHASYLRFLRLRQYQSLADPTTQFIAVRTRIASRALVYYVVAAPIVVLAFIVMDRVWG
jgi:hypothetical protein